MHYTRKILLLLLVVLCHYFAIAGGITKGPKPVWIKNIQPNLNANTPDKEIDDGYFQLLYDRQEGVATKTSYFHHAKKIVNQSGIETCSKLEFQYDKAFEHIIIHDIHIIRGSRTIDKLNLSKLKIIQKAKDMDNDLYDENMSGMYFVEDVRVGDVIEYSYSRVSNNPLFTKYTDEFDLQYSLPVGNIYARVVIPSNRKLYLRSVNNAPMPDQHTANGATEYVWDAKNVAALIKDDLTPTGYSPYATTEVSEYASWNEVKIWAENIYRNAFTSGDMVHKKAAEILTRNPEEADRIITALRFVQDQVRYLAIETGINTHIPHLPEQILKQGFGDCKDKSILLCCLLREMNITARPVMIQTEPSDDMDKQLPSPDAFDHVCVVVDWNGRTYFLDPTISYQRGSLTNTFFPNYKYGLIITGPTVGLSRIPFNADNSATVMSHKLQLPLPGEEGKLEVRTEYTGNDADNFRSEYHESSLAEIQKDYLDFYQREYDDISVIDSIKVVEDDSALNRIVTTETYRVSELWKDDGDQWKWELFGSNLYAQLNKPENKNRTAPIGITFPKDYTEKYEIHLPKEWDIKSTDETVENDAIRFNYSKKYVASMHNLLIDYSLKSKSYQTTVGSNKKYLRDIDKIGDKLGYELYYEKSGGTTTAANNGSSFSWLLVCIFLITLAIATYVCRRLYKEYDVTSGFAGSEPINFGGLLLLPMIAVTLTPLLMGYQLLTGDFFSQTITDGLLNRDSASYNPTAGGLIIFELISNGLILPLALFCAVLFYQRRSIFPRLYIIFLVSMGIVHLLDYALASNIKILGETSPISPQDVFRSLVQCAIWVPYMLFSQRVKQTFTRWHQKKVIGTYFR